VPGLYGGKDVDIPQASLAHMRARIAASASTHAGESQIAVHGDAAHAFRADYRPSYVKADAEDGWQRAIAWFRRDGAM